MLCFNIFIFVHLIRWALNFATVDVIDNVMGKTTIDCAPNRLSSAEDLLDGSWGIF